MRRPLTDPLYDHHMLISGKAFFATTLLRVVAVASGQLHHRFRNYVSTFWVLGVVDSRRPAEARSRAAHTQAASYLQQEELLLCAFCSGKSTGCRPMLMSMPEEREALSRKFADAADCCLAPPWRQLRRVLELHGLGAPAFAILNAVLPAVRCHCFCLPCFGTWLADAI